MDLTPLLSAFGIIALAELGDKTQLTAITLCCKHKPLQVFLGTALALILVNGIGVLIGGALAALLPMFWIGIGAGIVFIVFGIYTLFSKEGKEVKFRESKFAVLTSFLMVTLMELGDKTQLAVIAMTATSGGSLLIFLGASLAFLLVTGIAVTIGAAIQRVVPIRYIRIGAAIAFIIFGLLFLLSTIAGFELFL